MGAFLPGAPLAVLQPYCGSSSQTNVFVIDAVGDLHGLSVSGGGNNWSDTRVGSLGQPGALSPVAAAPFGECRERLI